MIFETRVVYEDGCLNTPVRSKELIVIHQMQQPSSSQPPSTSSSSSVTHPQRSLKIQFVLGALSSCGAVSSFTLIQNRLHPHTYVIGDTVKSDGGGEDEAAIAG